MKYRRHELKNVTRTELDNAIDETIIGYKAERNRVILRERLYDGSTYEELAEMHDMSVNQIKNIVYRELEKISKYLKVEV